MKKRLMTGGSTKAVISLYLVGDDGMNNWPGQASNLITTLPPFDHKEREDDDTGVPEHPIYSNYVKYLWKGHRRSGGVQAPDASVENTDTVARR